MLRRGILLLSLVMVTLGSSARTRDEDTESPEVDETQASLLTMSDVCFYDSPSFLCYLKCGQQNMRPFCDEIKGLCDCIPPEDEEGQGENQDEVETTESSEVGAEGNDTDDSENKLHMIFYIFDLSSLFGSTNGTNMTDVVNVTNILATDMPVEDLMEEETMKGWASSHILAIIIVALLSVLVIVELAACFKKQKGKQREANLFTSTLGIPNKS